MQLPVQLCELPVRQLVHQRSCYTRGERDTWLRCSGRSSGFDPVQSHNYRVSSPQWHGLPGVAISSCVSVSGHQRGIIGGGCTCREAAGSEQAEREALWRPMGAHERCTYFIPRLGQSSLYETALSAPNGPTGHNAVRAADGAVVHLRSWSPRWSPRPPQSLGRPPTPSSQQRCPNRQRQCAAERPLTQKNQSFGQT